MKKETQVDGLNKTTFVKEELENGGEVGIIDEQNINPHLKHNKELYNLNDGYSKSRAWKRVASIPTLEFCFEFLSVCETSCYHQFLPPPRFVMLK